MSTTLVTQYSDATGATARVGSVAILGAGRVGTALARGLVEAGLDVRVASSRPASAIELLVSVVAPGARAVDAPSAVDGADVVILAMPLSRIAEVDPSLLGGRVVVDVTNYWEPVDGLLPHFADGSTGTSEKVQALFPSARIVKAFNHVGYHDIDGDRRPAGATGRRAVAVASDDAEAAASVADMVERMGFDAVLAGKLAAGRALEAGGAIFGMRLSRSELAARL